MQSLKVVESLDVVYVLYNNYDELERSLSSLKCFINKTNFKLNIFIIDNSSQIVEAQKILRIKNLILQISQPNFLCNYYPSKNNMGFGKGCNFGADLGSGEIILFVNCDTDFSTFIYSDFYKHISLLADNLDTVGITGPKVLNINGSVEPSCFSFDPLAIFFKPLRHLEKISKLYKFVPKFKFIKNSLKILTYDEFPKNKLVEVDWISGCCMFISRKFFKISNGFDERYFLYFDDVDICRNAKLNNYKVIYDPRLVIRHFGKYQSSNVKGIYKSLIVNPTSRFHITSWLLYLIKWRKDLFLKFISHFKFIEKIGINNNKISFSKYKLFKYEKT